MTAPALPPLSRLYRESFDDVWAALRRLGVPPASLEDAVHDVFVVAHRRRDAFEGRSGARTWLLGIARRIAFRHRRTEARTLRRHRALAAAPLPAVSPADDAHEHVARREAWLALQRFLDALDRPQREAFVLGELQRLGRRELGVALGVSPDTAYSRLRAARARFSATFGQGPPSPRTVLAAGRHAEAPPAEARQRVWLALGSGLGHAVRPVATAAFGTKVVLTTAGLAGAVLGLVVTAAPGARSGPPTPSAPVAAVTTGAAHEEASAPSFEAPAASPSVLPKRHAPAEPGRRRALAPAPSSPGAPAPSSPGASAPSSPGAPAPSSPADVLAVEASLLRTAHAALARADAAAAIEALHEHRRRFPRGVLAEERDASIIRAECALGRRARAHEHARRFVAAHPHSAYLGALAESCVAAVTNPASAGDSRG